MAAWAVRWSPRACGLSAPYILEQFKHAGPGIASMSYWGFTDIFEENGPPPTPFHGGFGLLNFQGIKKPAYFAFQFLNQLGPLELQNTDAASWVCRDEKGGVQILLWDLTRLAATTVPNQEIYRKTDPAKAKGNVRIALKNIPPGTYHLALRQTGYAKNDAYTAYLKMGAPAQLTRAQENDLRAASTGHPESERDIIVGPDGTFSETLPLRENDVLLLSLTPK